MRLADGIKKHGFRKWYERELLQGHAHLVLLIFCVLGLLAAFEAAWRFRGWQDQLLDLAAGVVCAATGLWALRRYLGLLAGAEVAANQADCPQCQAYGRLELLKSDAESSRVAVRCRKCGHEWDITA
jgi:hypothetical protein